MVFELYLNGIGLFVGPIYVRVAYYLPVLNVSCSRGSLAAMMSPPRMATHVVIITKRKYCMNFVSLKPVEYSY
jgi:hypothetical protein